NDDRGTWCGQIGEALLMPHRTGGLGPRMLTLCKSNDLFSSTASCDREAVIWGSSVTADSVHGDRAKVTLSSGATLGLQRSDEEWYVTSIRGGKPQRIKKGWCVNGGVAT